MSKTSKGFIIPLLSVLMAGLFLFGFYKKEEEKMTYKDLIKTEVKDSHAPNVANLMSAIAPASTTKIQKQKTVSTLTYTSKEKTDKTEPAKKLETPINCQKAYAKEATPLDTENLEKELTIITDEKYYSVYSSNDQEIFNEIIKCSPVGKSANRNLDIWETGKTSYNIAWAYDWDESGGQCKLKNVRVGLHIVYTMPEWKQTDKASPETARRWQKYISNLWKHEKVHGQNSTAGAEKITDYLNNFSQSGTCASADSKINNDVKNLLKEIEEKDKKFDEDFSHVIEW